MIQRASKGEQVIISRGSVPVAMLVPVGPIKGKRTPGALKGNLQLNPEFFEPLPADELDAWEK